LAVLQVVKSKETGAMMACINFLNNIPVTEGKKIPARMAKEVVMSIMTYSRYEHLSNAKKIIFSLFILGCKGLELRFHYSP
jgi:hypothetical protein